MSKLIFAGIADDDTGATDLAGMLAERGVETLLIIDLPKAQHVCEWSRGCQAVVLAEGTRMIDPREAYDRTRRAIRLVAPFRPCTYAIKYCSTFDSTERGNIGSTIDAAMDELGEKFTIALPALPVNGRTTYMGYHFVHGQLLSDSPMRSHPLTPMTNPNLVDFLGRQTERTVGLLSYSVIEQGVAAIRRRMDQLRVDGVEIVITDCLADGHVNAVCEAAADLRLISGGSAPGIGLPGVWRNRGWLEDRGSASDGVRERPIAGCLLVAGSCSVATCGQNAWFAAGGRRVLWLDAKKLASGEVSTEQMVREAAAELSAGRHCLLTTSAAPEEVRTVQEWAAARGMSAGDLGLTLTRELAKLTCAILEDVPTGGLIAAGGETSGALCRGLGLGALRVGRSIEPGVPLCESLGRFQFPVVLKSGNFGSRDFYGRALRAMGY